MVLCASRLKNTVFIPRRDGLSDEWLRLYLSYLKEIIRKRGLNVKARDIIWVLGEYDHAAVSGLGILLSKLEEAGLARKWNNSRPTRYTLVPEWLWESYAEICDFKCDTGDTLCSLINICPYHVLREAGKHGK